MKVRHLVAVRRGAKTLRYWQPSSALRAQGWRQERLPDDIEAATARAEELNRHLDEVREGLWVRPQREVVKKPPPHPVGRRPNHGLSGVYVVGAAGADTVKIGIASDIAGRLVQLQTGSSVRLRVLFYISAPFDLAVAVERAVHDSFSRQKMAGEWFSVPAGDAIGRITSRMADAGLMVL